MKYSIILPIYKVEKYLPECIESVLSQSYKDFEIILVDDGSPDNCPKMCDKYAEKYDNVKVIHQPNAGLACARNTGLKHASGEYIIFIDSDDYLSENNALEKIDKGLKESEDILIYGYKKYYESTSSFGVHANKFTQPDTPMKPAPFLKLQLQEDSYTGTAWAKVVKRRLLVDNDIQFKPGMISEDIDWYLQVLLAATSMVAINDVLYIYRMREGSISHDVKEKSIIDNLWILEYWPDRIKHSDAPKDLIEVLMTIMARYMGNMMVLFATYRTEIRKKYSDRVKALLYLFNYATTPRAITIKRFIKFLGFRHTTHLLVLANKYRRKT